MKKTFLMSMMLLVGIVAFAQQPVITFTETEHDFGQIKESDGKVSTVFTFKNEGMEPLVLSNVRASCGCTTPTWTKTPIEPGETGTITVTYNPAGRPGRFTKSITITSNATSATVKLYIKGEVIPKEAKPEDKYPKQMGGLHVSKQEIHFGNVQNTKNVTRSLEYANFTDKPITVTIYQKDHADYLVPVLTLTTIQPKQSGSLKIHFDATKCKELGAVNTALYIVVNGKRVVSDDYKVTIHANVVEDFSHLTPEERQQAPIFDISSRKVDFGVVKANGKYTQELILKNAGVNPLLIHKVVCRNTTNLTAKVTKTNIKSGKTANLTLALDTHDMKPANYARQVEIITNDPNRPRLFLTITWKVE